MKYKMIVEMPITEVPEDVSIQEAKVAAEVWLKLKVPDAVMISFLEANE